MKALGLIFTFFGRQLPSFSRIGITARRLTFSKLVLDAREQTWLITGASGGLGATLAREACQRGARIIAVARSRDKLEAMRASLCGAGGEVTLLQADCANMQALAELADSLSGTQIDVLVNNVGVMLADYAKTEEGLETSYATNVLGHFVLTEALLNNGCLGAGAIVISMSSGGMYNVPLVPTALNASPAEYNGTRAYALHKRAQVALTDTWKSRFADRDIEFYVMHPGWVDTPGVKSAMPQFRRLLAPVLRNERQGIDTALWLAATRPISGSAKIWFDRKPRPTHIHAATRQASAPAAELYDWLAQDVRRLSIGS